MAKSGNKKSRTHFYRRIQKHFGTEPGKLKIVSCRFAPYDRPNVHLALEALFRKPKIKAELEGIVCEQPWDHPSFAKLSREATARQYFEAPVEYMDVEVAEGKRLACVTSGVYWIRWGKQPLGLLITQSQQTHPPRITVEVIARTQDLAQDFLRELTALVQDSPAFRGKVFSLTVDCYREVQIQFHRLPKIAREEIVLPAQVLDRLDRHAMGFVRHGALLKESGRHMKRGVLLHGQPGTGKTLSAMYLAALMPGRTVMILTGGGLSSVESTGELARALAPVTVILEDVDLIGTMREHQSVSANALLFELLNQMDGLAEDADVLFVLTTNRPDVLEPALASRPGRIDQAIEIPMPDDECRRRLIELYGKGLALRISDPQKLVSRTRGVSAAFIRELLRRATLFAAEADGNGNRTAITIEDAHLEAALEELLHAGGRFTQVLLGALPASPSA